MIINKAIRFFKFGMVTMQVLAVGVALWETYKKSQSRIQEPDMKKKFHKNRDIVDESSWESFPTSDAPSSHRFT